MTTCTNISRDPETSAERYKRISKLADETPKGETAPITYGDALFALRYVAEDATQSPELRRGARQARCTMINRMRQRRLAENGGKASQLRGKEQSEAKHDAN